MKKPYWRLLVSGLEGVYKQRGLHLGEYTNGSDVGSQNIGGSLIVVYIQADLLTKFYVILTGSYQMTDLLKI